MNLFSTPPTANLLPCDGSVIYHGPVMSLEEARRHEAALRATVPWKSDETVIFGKRIVTARQVAWYGDAGCAYTYSGTTKLPLPWTPEVLELKALVETITGTVFNSCLLNLYHHGDEGMSWHSDDEKSIQADSPIASLSLGAKRKFAFKHKHLPPTTSLMLENGSLLVMQGSTQRHWLHSLPKTKKVLSPRINLTFRVMA